MSVFGKVNQYFCKSDTEKQITTKKVTLMGIKIPGLQTIIKLCLEILPKDIKIFKKVLK